MRRLAFTPALICSALALFFSLSITSITSIAQDAKDGDAQPAKADDAGDPSEAPSDADGGEPLASPYPTFDHLPLVEPTPAPDAEARAEHEARVKTEPFEALDEYYREIAGQVCIGWQIIDDVGLGVPFEQCFEDIRVSVEEEMRIKPEALRDEERDFWEEEEALQWQETSFGPRDTRICRPDLSGPGENPWIEYPASHECRFNQRLYTEVVLELNNFEEHRQSDEGYSEKDFERRCCIELSFEMIFLGSYSLSIDLPTDTLNPKEYRYHEVDIRMSELLAGAGCIAAFQVIGPQETPIEAFAHATRMVVNEDDQRYGVSYKDTVNVSDLHELLAKYSVPFRDGAMWLKDIEEEGLYHHPKLGMLALVPRSVEPQTALRLEQETLAYHEIHDDEVVVLADFGTINAWSGYVNLGELKLDSGAVMNVSAGLEWTPDRRYPNDEESDEPAPTDELAALLNSFAEEYRPGETRYLLQHFSFGSGICAAIVIDKATGTIQRSKRVRVWSGSPLCRFEATTRLFGPFLDTELYTQYIECTHACETTNEDQVDITFPVRKRRQRKAESEEEAEDLPLEDEEELALRPSVELALPVWPSKTEGVAWDQRPSYCALATLSFSAIDQELEPHSFRVLITQEEYANLHRVYLPRVEGSDVTWKVSLTLSNPERWGLQESLVEEFEFTLPDPVEGQENPPVERSFKELEPLPRTTPIDGATVEVSCGGRTLRGPFILHLSDGSNHWLYDDTVLDENNPPIGLVDGDDLIPLDEESEILFDSGWPRSHSPLFSGRGKFYQHYSVTLSPRLMLTLPEVDDSFYEIELASNSKRFSDGLSSQQGGFEHSLWVPSEPSTLTISLAGDVGYEHRLEIDYQGTLLEVSAPTLAELTESHGALRCTLERPEHEGAGGYSIRSGVTWYFAHADPDGSIETKGMHRLWYRHEFNDYDPQTFAGLLRPGEWCAMPAGDFVTPGRGEPCVVKFTMPESGLLDLTLPIIQTRADYEEEHADGEVAASTQLTISLPTAAKAAIRDPDSDFYVDVTWIYAEHAKLASCDVIAPQGWWRAPEGEAKAEFDLSSFRISGLPQDHEVLIRIAFYFDD